MHYIEVYFSQRSEFGVSPDSSKTHLRRETLATSCLLAPSSSWEKKTRAFYSAASYNSRLVFWHDIHAALSKLLRD